MFSSTGHARPRDREQAHRRHHRREREQQRDSRRHERAEGDHEDDDRDRQRQQAGTLEVLVELLVDLLDGADAELVDREPGWRRPPRRRRRSPGRSCPRPSRRPRGSRSSRSRSDGRPRSGRVARCIRAVDVRHCCDAGHTPDDVRHRGPERRVVGGERLALHEDGLARALVECLVEDAGSARTHRGACRCRRAAWCRSSRRSRRRRSRRRATRRSRSCDVGRSDPCARLVLGFRGDISEVSCEEVVPAGSHRPACDSVGRTGVLACGSRRRGMRLAAPPGWRLAVGRRRRRWRRATSPRAGRVATTEQGEQPADDDHEPAERCVHEEVVARRR